MGYLTPHRFHLSFPAAKPGMVLRVLRTWSRLEGPTFVKGYTPENEPLDTQNHGLEEVTPL